jgi:hypothetical protein
MTNFSFEVQGKTHKFEASTASERDSWVVAIEKQIEESKTLKDEITAKDSYKKNVEDYCKFGYLQRPLDPPGCMIDD